MSYSVEKLPGEPIILYVGHQDHQVAVEIENVVLDVTRLLDAQSEPVYFVNDLRAERTPTVDELIMAADLLARKASAMYHHPMVRKLVVVTNNEVIRAAYQGGASKIFGNIHAVIFDTLDEALAYARAGG